MRLTAIGFLCVLLLSVSPAPGADLEDQAKRIEGKLMSPCCMTNTVDVHESGASYEIRREIREMLGEGRSESEILDHYVAEHGPQILAVPRAKGFSATAYLFPILFLILTVGGLTLAMRRWRATDRDAAPEPAQPAPDEAYAERLKRDLEELD